MSNAPTAPLTADTITDEQIRELQERIAAHPEFGASIEVHGMYRACEVALEYERMQWIRDERAQRARGLCAMNYNAEFLRS